MALHAFPVRDGSWFALQVGLPAGEFIDLPVVNRHFVGVRSHVIPQIFNPIAAFRLDSSRRRSELVTS